MEMGSAGYSTSGKYELPHGTGTGSEPPEIDLEDITEHVEMIHTLATGCEGKLVVCSYGQDPATGIDIPSYVRSFCYR